MDDERPDPPPPPGDAPPSKPLDYFAAYAPDGSTRPESSTGWVFLGLGWIPFICGIVNSQATALSGVPNIINAHRNAAILFSGLGFVSTIVSIVMFIRHRDSFGFLVAILFLFFATGAAVCLIGFARH